MTTSPTVAEFINTPKRVRRRAPKRAGRRLPPGPRVTVIVTLLVRLVSLLAQHIHSHIVGEGGFNAIPYGGLDDGRYYYTTAEQLADGVTPDYVLNSFPRVIAVFMDLGIRNLLALKLISFAVSSIAVVLIASMAWHMSIGMRLPARRWAVIVASFLGGLFPSNVFWTTNSLMRDGWILSFVLIAIWSFSDVGRGNFPRIRWALGFVALVAAASFRPYVVPVFLAALVSSQFEYLNPMRHLKPRVGSVLIRLTLLAVGFIGVCLMVAPALAGLTGFNILDWRTQEELLNKGSSLGLAFVGENPLIVVAYYLLSFVSNAIGPLPFQIKLPIHALALIEVPTFIIVAAGLLKANYSNRLVRFCSLFGLYWLLLLGLWNDVIGTASRNRIMAWPILAIAASPAIAQFLSERFHPEESGDSGGRGRRHFDRRIKQRRRIDSREPVLSDSGEQSEQGALSSVSTFPASPLELDDWFHINAEGRVQKRQSYNDRRSAQRRGTRGRFEVPEVHHVDSCESTGESVVDHDEAKPSSANSDPYDVEPEKGVADDDGADVQYPLFDPRRRTARGTSVLKVSRSGTSGRKEQ